ncbi:guanosine-3',5'-bis(diphosphate) 3'-pyrophosphohydrolase MESH1 isoform X1 [Rhinatrema bivittatum]|uniref:guanosine-3',5'-bis(diphosphate) 3'-pyrophosphohydrolase MESH1 isoform X1 n=1 Tax=Rhinatrema bivittatum TaxID=194408 RepID=UPI00112B72D7|nr:guanosine-3',5'-bis(diphosphate) 3'-pyrophosphohydrolase MESH1 isoform X1 [Rhinatrema bivittatum]
MSSEAARLLEAADFAAKKHRSQRRKDPEGTPYINHPIGVARILSHEAGVTDTAVLQAALLHDTVEDTDTTFLEIEEKFGKEIRQMVEEVTDDKTLPKRERKRLQIEHARHCSQGARLVKLADKLYNLRDLNRCTPTAWLRTTAFAPPPSAEDQRNSEEQQVPHQVKRGRSQSFSLSPSAGAEAKPSCLD